MAVSRVACGLMCGGALIGAEVMGTLTSHLITATDPVTPPAPFFS
jgi:hypothetical protein